ncbi:carbohydrate kinase [Gorgonomyces haynaldii]|nr:carbohydrate kinase [Gorgonomyces haynaldii]
MQKRIIVMGVSASGKTTLAKELAQVFGYEYVEADDFHPLENKLKMQQGIGLTDDDRWPWLHQLFDQVSQKESFVLACSCLKRIYRDFFRRIDGIQFIYLKISKALVEKRMRSRVHYAGVSLIESQFQTLEEPNDEPDVETRLCA